MTTLHANGLSARLKEYMNERARAIWDGQGDLTLKERVTRIKAALIGIGYDAEDLRGLDLPHPEFRKYL